ncbi:30S ribosome-binding factor RbfA [Streptomyces albus]|uniref:Ribosome-binding factor A n=1 Tax=Streptomyces albus TaxID=1888 RepID=A0A6C1C802_9ACTN|nr:MULTISPECIES: 30S ribosome-binding factor RbfA [Streptomyces]EPD94028.1 ribosome-binding factor A [Streptomyces sp. HPH0547]MDI6409592.1 30S ribosome-binding factor RbfA [Streptomyces albus]QID38490.1 30S ribosome-binding factor RbfA [Streptomyces albus]TGG78013.1 30S ribosome-binding factor RbfA [Streptomyces albus]UVN54517.1 30S ribosome-binding factor RbfA [Streptomyces albus]
MADNARAKRLADLIREVVAEKLHRGIKDPRLGTHVTVTDTRVTGDLREATVFYTVFGDDEDRKAAAAGLESAKGVLRSAVGKAAGIKHTPSLTFVADALPENARTLDDALARARAADEEVRKASSGATYAGDADPYRKPGEAELDEDGGEADDAAGGKDESA